jgi:HSP90 family molecular chaperone
VFLRELLSNSSDALEKQRFKAQANEDLVISIEVNPTKKQLTIQDNGIGMTREELISNLGTIAKSGSKEFLKKMEEEGKATTSSNIIGQFGVGFYSSFIVADHVEAISKAEGQPAHKWSSDGSGTFDIEEVEEKSFERGTKVVLHIKEECKQFL